MMEMQAASRPRPGDSPQEIRRWQVQPPAQTYSQSFARELLDQLLPSPAQLEVQSPNWLEVAVCHQPHQPVARSFYWTARSGMRSYLGVGHAEGNGLDASLVCLQAQRFLSKTLQSGVTDLGRLVQLLDNHLQSASRSSPSGSASPPRLSLALARCHLSQPQGEWVSAGFANQWYCQLGWGVPPVGLPLGAGHYRHQPPLVFDHLATPNGLFYLGLPKPEPQTAGIGNLPWHQLLPELARMPSAQAQVEALTRQFPTVPNQPPLLAGTLLILRARLG